MSDNASPKDIDEADKLAAARSDDHPEADEGRFDDVSMQNVHSQLVRENCEPKELSKPVPMTLMWGIFLLFAWGGFYMARYSGDFKFDVFNEDARPGVAEVAEVVDYYSLDWQMERGARLFGNNCAACHQANGEGLAGVYPPLAGSPWVTEDENLILKILLRGLQGDIVVLGNTYNGAMPSYGDNGSNWRDRDIAAVATYVRQSFGNDAAPITQEMIESARAAVADRSAAWTAEELLAEHPLP